MSNSCAICERIARRESSPFFIHDFRNSILVVGDHQFHRGYCVLLYKQHVREMHELSRDAQRQLFEELMAATSAIAKAFAPWKMNHACFGNQVPHLHWHIVPRYESDPDRLEQPFLHSAEFSRHATTDEVARSVAAQVRKNL
jgi:diadenosine tetraphosphate (Ap4A) HIT family hydrolase